MKRALREKLEELSALSHDEIHPINIVWLRRQLRLSFAREELLHKALEFVYINGGQARDPGYEMRTAGKALKEHRKLLDLE
jgi:hypothetical protein